MTITVEFAVQMSCDSCVTKIENSLKDVEGVKRVKVSKEDGSVVIESTLPSSVLLEKIEGTGRKAVLKGCDGNRGGREVFDIMPVDLSGICESCKSNVAVELKVEASDIVKVETAKDENRDAALSDPDSGGLKRKRVRGDSKSDDEEELELKYSSDSEDGGGFSARLENFNTDEDIWKIDEDLDAEFDDVAEEDQIDPENSQSGDKDADKRKISGSEDGEKTKTDDSKGPKKRWRPDTAGNKFLSDLKAFKVKKGKFEITNLNIVRNILILPVDEGEVLTEKEAQEIKDNIVHEVFKKSQKVQANEPDAFLLKFGNCKIVDPGWLLICCDDDVTFNWLLSWDVPKPRDKDLKTIPALDKAPLYDIKFSIKSKWALDVETMLKLIHLQNRELNTKRWVFEEKKDSAAAGQQFKFKIDVASITSLEKLNWSFFYELLAVKVIECNGKHENSLLFGYTSVYGTTGAVAKKALFGQSRVVTSRGEDLNSLLT